MALAIGVHRGDKIFLNDVPLEVLEVKGYEQARVRVKDQVFNLSDKENTEVLPDVHVCCGVPFEREVEITNEDGEDEIVEPQSRLLFEAPSSIRILRESLYRKKNGRATV